MSTTTGAGGPVHLTVNGETRSLPEPCTVAALVEILGVGPKGVAVAVNRTVVPRSSWSQHWLGNDDRVEVLQAAQGG